MNKSLESSIQDIDAAGGSSAANFSYERQLSSDVQESTGEDNVFDGDDYIESNKFESNLRRRKGKIISCAKETIQHASRQLRRRVPYAGHLMTPRRLWLNKIPTQCDVVIEFPEDAPDEALRWLLSRIRSQPTSGLGLVVQVKAHESSRRNAFYISAPINVLFKAAEEARLPKRLRPDLGGALREFTTRESHCFLQQKSGDGVTSLFSSQERQWLVLQVLQGLRAGQTDIDALQGRAAVAEGQSIVAAWQETGLITQVFPLHEVSALTQLQSNWVKQIFAPQPLDDIAEYFGVKVALYFAWLGHYTCALGVPAFFGTILYAILWGKGQTAQDMGHLLFSLFNVAWVSLYLEAWKRYSVELAFRWGTLSTPPELLEPPRPLYKGPLVESNVTGRLEPTEAPAWKRRAFRYLVSFPVIGLCLFLVFVVMFVMLRFQEWLDYNNIPDRGITQCLYNLHKDWWDSKLPEGFLCCLSVIPKVLLAGAITLMDEAYYKLAVWLNDKENYRLQSKYENHLIAKVALFQFVNSFLSLFYIAFYLRDEDKLKEQLAGLLISRQIIGNLRESAIPYFVEQLKLAKLSFNMWGALSPTQDVNRSIMDTASTTSTDNQSPDTSQEIPTKKQEAASSRRNIGQAEIESSLCKYDGTFSDHLEMLVQMGYVVLFSAAFPLAGVCALINNLMEIRSDAFKLAHVHQRPFGQRVANIGTWQNAFSILSLAAVIVNCALIGLSGQVSRLWPGLTTTQTIILIVALEHIMLGIRSALTWLLPELPSWLAAEIARAEHCRREMQCKGTSPRPTPPTPPTTTFTQQAERDLLLPLNGASIGACNTTDVSLESQYADEEIHAAAAGAAMYHQQFNPPCYNDENSMYALQRNIEADVNVFENRDSSPESPPSQTNTILIRPLLDSTPPNSGASLQSLNHDVIHGVPCGAPANSASTLALTSKQAMHLPEIPPFRKQSTNSADYTGSSAGSSPQRGRQHLPNPSTSQQQQPDKIAEIPPYKQRKISAESTLNSQSNDKPNVKRHAPEWMSRLKVNDNASLHRSIDCIAKELIGNAEIPDIIKPAPSWSNVAMKSSACTLPQQMVGSSSSSSGGGVGTAAATVGSPVGGSSRPSVGAISTSSSSSRRSEKKEQTAASSHNKSTVSGTGNSGSGNSATATAGGDDEAKKAELAAKKSRLKQKLVKSARSVAIFSLKLKERRQREAEKAAIIALEHAKALAKLPPPPQFGGELSLIPIEHLIQIDDIKPNLRSPPSSATPATTSSSTTLLGHHDSF